MDSVRCSMKSVHLLVSAVAPRQAERNASREPREHRSVSAQSVVARQHSRQPEVRKPSRDRAPAPTMRDTGQQLEFPPDASAVHRRACLKLASSRNALLEGRRFCHLRPMAAHDRSRLQHPPGQARGGGPPQGWTSVSARRGEGGVVSNVGPGMPGPPPCRHTTPQGPAQA